MQVRTRAQRGLTAHIARDDFRVDPDTEDRLSAPAGKGAQGVGISGERRGSPDFEASCAPSEALCASPWVVSSAACIGGIVAAPPTRPCGAALAIGKAMATNLSWPGDWCAGSACIWAAWRAAGPLPYRRAHAGPAIVGQRGWRRRTVQVCRSRRPRAALAQRRAQSLRKIVMLRLQADAEHRAARPLVHVVLGPLHTQRCRTVMSRSTGELMRVQRADACDVQVG